MNYEISSEDFATAVRAVALRKHWRRAYAVQSWRGERVLSGGILAGVTAIISLHQHVRGLSWGEMNWIALLTVAAVSYLLITSPLRYQRCLQALYKSFEFEGRTFSAVWQPEGLRIASEGSETLLVWSAFKGYLKTDKLLVLLAPGESLHILPLRFFPAHQRTELLASVESHVHALAEIRSRR